MSRCVFLDRDGVINRKPALGEYVLRWEDFHLIPSIVDWIRLFKALGYLVIVVTNQRCVARDMLTAGQLENIHERMKAELQRRGAYIDAIYCCPHEAGVCDCRKPKPGLVMRAVREWDIDVSRSILIGDSPSDQELADTCGMPFVAVANGSVIDEFRDVIGGTY